MTIKITADTLLAAYADGYFPMAKSRDDPQLYWFHPEQRGVLPLETFHVPVRLARFMRKRPFTVTVDKAFADVIRACAVREDTWINNTIIALYCELHERGFAHSVECWREDTLVGGVYGVALGGAFFGESMFSRTTNASKVALVHLVELLKKTGYRLLDTQYVNDHLKQFGAEEIAREEYMRRLDEALNAPPQAWPTSVE